MRHKPSSPSPSYILVSSSSDGSDAPLYPKALAKYLSSRANPLPVLYSPSALLPVVSPSVQSPSAFTSSINLHSDAANQPNQHVSSPSSSFSSKPPAQQATFSGLSLSDPGFKPPHSGVLTGSEFDDALHSADLCPLGSDSAVPNCFSHLVSHADELPPDTTAEAYVSTQILSTCQVSQILNQVQELYFVGVSNFLFIPPMFDSDFPGAEDKRDEGWDPLSFLSSSDHLVKQAYFECLSKLSHPAAAFASISLLLSRVQHMLAAHQGEPPITYPLLKKLIKDFSYLPNAAADYLHVVGDSWATAISNMPQETLYQTNLSLIARALHQPFLKFSHHLQKVEKCMKLTVQSPPPSELQNVSEDDLAFRHHQRRCFVTQVIRLLYRGCTDRLDDIHRHFPHFS